RSSWRADPRPRGCPSHRRAPSHLVHRSTDAIGARDFDGEHYRTRLRPARHRRTPRRADAAYADEGPLGVYAARSTPPLGRDACRLSRRVTSYAESRDTTSRLAAAIRAHRMGPDLARERHPLA